MQEPKAQCSCGSTENNKSEVNKKIIIEDKLSCHNPNQIENNICTKKCSIIPIKATKTEELICSCKLKDSITDINLQNDQWKAEGENIGHKYKKTSVKNIQNDENCNIKPVVEEYTEKLSDIKIISEVPENIELSEHKNETISEKQSVKSVESVNVATETITFEELDCCTVEGCDSFIPAGIIPKICPLNQRSRVVIKIRLNDLLKDKPFIHSIKPQKEPEILKKNLIQNEEEIHVDVQPEKESMNISKDKIINITNKKSKKGKYYYTKEEATLLDNIKKLFKRKTKKKKTVIFSQAPEKIPTSECRIKVEVWEKHDANICSGDEKYSYIGELLFPVCGKEIFYKPPGVPIRQSMKSYSLNDPNKFGKTEIVQRLYAYKEKIIPYDIVNNDSQILN